ncbi:hypothetical protein RsoM2USA_479 [Ralstonia phage RsoM2USA]|nr:hypothetical protein RsoM2USA_479 [Ralstonia phage RsoM2USA]
MMDFIKKFLVGFLVLGVPCLLFAGIYFFFGANVCMYTFFGLAYTIVAIVLCWIAGESILEEIHARRRRKSR